MTDRNAHTPTTPRRATLKTIAEETGLGITTVSRALKDAADIGAETKQRVREAAQRQGYRPNRAGVRLRTGKTHVIALILSVDEEGMGSASHILYGLSEALSGTPYHLIMTPHFISADPLEPIRYIIETGSADGVVISRTEPDDPRVRLLLESSIPFVTHGRTDMGEAHPWHDFDNERFVFEALVRLRERGRRHVAILMPPPNLTCRRHVQAGIAAATALGGLEVAALSATTDSGIQAIREEVLGRLACDNPPDGLLSIFGDGAIAMLSATEAAERRIGEDIDLVCKQPHDVLRWLHPQVIAINEDNRETGRQLGTLLLSAIDGQPAAMLTSLLPPLWDGRS